MPVLSPAVSVIVVNWNRHDLLRACLESLLRQTFRDFEIIVVDNGSSDGSLELLRSAPFEQIRTIENPDNRGFCAANNQGIEAARGEFIALLNNDAEAEPRWLEQLLAAAAAEPGVGMAASKILTWEDRGVIDKAGHLIYPDGQNRGRGTGEPDRGQYDRLEEAAWPDGCAALYRRSMIEQVGGFDEDFFAYADDAELGLRARIAGWGCLYVPTAVVYHHTGSTLGRYSAERLFLIERNRIWLAAKLFPWSLLVLNPAYFAVRMAATVWFSFRGKGELPRAASRLGSLGLLKCLIKAQWAALIGLPAMLRKRRALNAFRKLNSAETIALIQRFRIPLPELVTGSR
jgi:GT2 family glycosyltransferase